MRRQLLLPLLLLVDVVSYFSKFNMHCIVALQLLLLLPSFDYCFFAANQVLRSFIFPVPNLVKPELTRPPLLLAGALPSPLTNFDFGILAATVAVTAHCTIALPPAIGFFLYC